MRKKGRDVGSNVGSIQHLAESATKTAKSKRLNGKSKAKTRTLTLRKSKQAQTMKHRTIRQRTFLINKYRNIKRFSLVLAHGELFSKKDNRQEPLTVNVPRNIRLFMFSNPRKELNIIDAYYILKQLVDVNSSGSVKLKVSIDELKEPPTLINKTTNKKYLPTGEFHIYEPNKEITNMVLNFDNQMREWDIILHPKLMLPDGTIEQCSQFESNENCINKTYTTLEKTLEKISSRANPDEILDVMFLSCKSGKDYYDVGNLIQDMKTVTISSTKKHYYTNDIIDEYSVNMEEKGFVASNFFKWIEDNFYFEKS
jgi:hypothetical protein